ncbi:hypothetical protein OIU85_002873 [Salix viminalis]|uniref:DUF4283 domain-containing protein n=1 Tax=Salix viminalis TaxID=40686 RepID=A0A9Q0VS03_SALVM|nr:hypothetical protein OIU85_002873 [Salix viminalis]
MNNKKPEKPHQKTNQASGSSWADRVKVTDASTRFTLDPIPPPARGQQMEITEDMLTEHAEQWNRSMVGFFPGYKMNYHAVNSIASRVWKSCGLEAVMTTATGFIIFRFQKEEQMLEILEKGPWLFGGKAIILQQWHPHFVFDKNKISKLPVWIRIHGLPFPLWSRKGLSLVASKVGKPLSCDESTYTCSRLDFARVCVELDAGTPFVHNFDIITPLSTEPLHIEVEYEWKPTRCASCNLFGHSCKMVEKVEPVKVPIDGGALEGTLLGEGCLRDINEKEKTVDHSNMSETKQNPTDTESSSAYTQRGKAKKGTNSQHNERPTTAQPVKENREKGKGVIVDTGHDLELVELDDVALKDVVRPHEHETQRCTGNKVAFFQSQNITGEGDTSSGDSPVVDTNETSENSSLAYTKVKKKKGGKKKGKEVHCL